MVAIGNPVFNPKVRELYLKIIQGEEVAKNAKDRAIQTEISINKHLIDFGSFDWHKEQEGNFIFYNKGNVPLIIEEVFTSCGCTTVDYPKEPVRPGMSVRLHVVYKADYPEHFNKTITVYCNAGVSPIILKVSGDAE